MKARVGDEKIEVYRDMELTIPLGLQFDAGSEVEFERVTNRRNEFVGRVFLPDERMRFGFLNLKLFQPSGLGTEPGGLKLDASLEGAPDHSPGRERWTSHKDLRDRAKHLAAATEPVSERLATLDKNLDAKFEEWSHAVLSGLIGGIVMAIARSRLGPSGFLVAAFAYAFLILRINFTILQRLLATVLMLTIGFYWRETRVILGEWLK